MSGKDHIIGNFSNHLNIAIAAYNDLEKQLRELRVGRTGWMLERKPCGNKPPMWWKGGRPPLATDDVWTQDPNDAVVWADGASATSTLSAMLRMMEFRTQSERDRYLKLIGVTEHIWMPLPAPNNQ